MRYDVRAKPALTPPHAALNAVLLCSTLSYVLTLATTRLTPRSTPSPPSTPPLSLVDGHHRRTFKLLDGLDEQHDRDRDRDSHSRSRSSPSTAAYCKPKHTLCNTHSTQSPGEDGRCEYPAPPRPIPKSTPLSFTHSLILLTLLLTLLYSPIRFSLHVSSNYLYAPPLLPRSSIVPATPPPTPSMQP